MPHQKAAFKDLRQTKKRTAFNATVKKNIAYLRKAALKAVSKKDAKGAMELYTKLSKAVDKAARKNILKKNNAARKKSRLMQQINALVKVKA
ncbi:MAG: 30S ribosomal protein S20 [bacterium]|nr:30S ribosomal protein S20 [bacterium]